MSTLHADDGAVVLTIDADVAVISLNRPHRLNAVNDQLVEGLLDALSEIEAGECGAALLTGRGRAFCAGHDLKEPRGGDDGLLRRLERLQEVTRRIRGLSIPVIAAVHGHAVGAGAEFALGCDLVVAAEGTRFRFPEVGLGLSVTGGLTKLLPLFVGPIKAKELLLLGEAIDAREAMRLGLVNRVVPPSELTGATMEWARRLASQPRVPTALAKAALDNGIDAAFGAGLELEISHAIITDGVAKRGDQALAASRARNRGA
ncbi:MAG TPA: enoyl-CoA hydratase/isomerase family protein [Jatrophihabitans sp.]|nr:enoyl-CoA hydratase/isomerase family protein [Jatrophihabitans sp.]